MCGIAGILEAGGHRVDRADLQALAKAMTHRGPDGEGLWISPDESVGMVHRRLAILDVSDLGHQPMRSADGRFTIVFNGEIFNFLELRDELAACGHRFISDSDTEVILAAWQEWGEGMLLRFNGMWAIALHDSLKAEVLFARDRFGIKPLVYATRGQRLAFASEMRALETLPWADGQFDLDVARRLLFDPFSVEGGPRSIVASIRRLPPGHLAYWRQGRIQEKRWWRTVDHLPTPPQGATEQSERFLELFLDAIRLRMRSDVTLGTCLSGGFDSSAIVCAMSEVAQAAQGHQREASDWRHAFIASFPGRSNDETPLALEAANWAGVTPHALDMSEVDDPALIGRVLRDLDEIHIGLPMAPWQIYRSLRRHGTVVSLDGHGADELMGGYRQSGQGLAFALRNHLTSLSSRSALAGRTVESSKLVGLRLQGLSFLRDHRWLAPRELDLPAERDELPEHWGPLNRRLYRMFHSTVLPTILRNFDRLSMAHGIEVRMPFMDWRLVTFVMSLPDQAKIDGELTKAVARRAMAGRMPESIRSNARKVGFNSPMPEWLNGDLGRWALACLDSPNEAYDSLVDRSALMARVRALHRSRTWNWESAGRLWPSVKWVMDGRPETSFAPAARP